MHGKFNLSPEFRQGAEKGLIDGIVDLDTEFEAGGRGGCAGLLYLSSVIILIQADGTVLDYHGSPGTGVLIG